MLPELERMRLVRRRKGDMMIDRQPVMSGSEVAAYLDEVFPQMIGEFRDIAVGAMSASVSQTIQNRHLRPGGTVSGPTMFALADCAYYAATLGMVGRKAQCVTTGLTINFLRRPPVADLRADARILKLGKLLSTGDVTIYSDGVDGPVAHVVVTYAIPPER